MRGAFMTAALILVGLTCLPAIAAVRRGDSGRTIDAYIDRDRQECLPRWRQECLARWKQECLACWMRNAWPVAAENAWLNAENRDDFQEGRDRKGLIGTSFGRVFCPRTLHRGVENIEEKGPIGTSWDLLWTRFFPAFN